MLRRILPVLLVALSTGCRPQPGSTARAPATAPTAAPSAPSETAPEVAAPAVTSDEDLALRRAEYEALAQGDARRRPLRAALAAWSLGAAQRAIDAKRPEDGLEQLKEALALWSWEDIVALETAPARDGARLLTVSADLERLFRRRGAHQPVFLTLAVQRSLRPDDKGATERWGQVRDWVMRRDGSDESTRERMIEALEAAVVLWPSRAVVEELAQLYLQYQDAAPRMRTGLRGRLAEMLGSEPSASSSLRAAALYLRVSRPADALAIVKRLDADGGSELREALEKHLAPGAGPEDAVRLAALFTRPKELHAVAERICRDATGRFPSAPEPWLCVGEFAAQRERLVVALRAFEEARRLSPERWETWDALAQLYHQRLFQLAGDERLDGLLAEMERARAMHEAARKRFPGRPLSRSLAAAVFELARGYYNTGRIDEAVRNCEASLAQESSIAALELLGQIEAKRGRPALGIERLQKAIAAIPADLGAGERRYLEAKLHRTLGDALEALGELAKASIERRRSLKTWDALLRSGRLRDETLAEVEVERGKLLYHLGERNQALIAFERAIDQAPEREATYADALAFLIPRGEREEALDAYHRALGRPGVSDYIKVYCSLWIVDLDRRAGQPEDPLARAYLEGIDGAKWFHDLARWATGRQTDEAIDARADTPARRAEIHFYRSLRRLEAGDREGARALWQKVLETQMMGFFEYDMAAHYLRHGARTEPAIKPVPRTPARVPEDSI